MPVNGLFDKPIRLSPAEEVFERQKSIVASDDFANDAPHRAYQDEQWTVPAPLDPAEIAPTGPGWTWRGNGTTPRTTGTGRSPTGTGGCG
ncbi:hypothetical protein NKG94_21540 [Micromonospora sp. M12]